VINGEPYNKLELRTELQDEYGAEFGTEGDGQPIVVAFHHCGPAAIRRLLGMFAFASWDTVERSPIIARDPFGIKPLYLASGEHGTVFASEKKSVTELLDLVVVDTSLDTRALQHYVTLQYVPEDESLTRGVRRLESGCHATLTPGAAPV